MSEAFRQCGAVGARLNEQGLSHVSPIVIIRMYDAILVESVADVHIDSPLRFGADAGAQVHLCLSVPLSKSRIDSTTFVLCMPKQYSAGCTTSIRSCASEENRCFSNESWLIAGGRQVREE